MRVVFLKPPFFRLVGSHNNKVPVELTYWRAFVERAGGETELYNGDFSHSRKFWSWRTLFKRTEMYKNAVDGGQDALLFEVVESVLSLQPDCVVIPSDDCFIPAVGMDNAFVNARMSRMFRARGIRTVGIGVMYSVDRQWDGDFDLMLAGGPNSGGAEWIMAPGKKGAYYCGMWNPAVNPSIRGVMPSPMEMDYSYVVGSRGCDRGCEFCYNKDVSPKVVHRPPEMVRDDIVRRMTWTGGQRYYMTDQIFGADMGRLEALAYLFAESPVRDCMFTVEGRADCINRAKVDLMAKMGVRVVKLGVENVGVKFGAEMGKMQGKKQIRAAVKMLRAKGIDVAAYLMLGGDAPISEYKETLAFCKDVNFDSYVVNMLSFPKEDVGTDRHRYDAHFSVARMPEWVVTPEILQEYLKLQASAAGNPNLSFFGLGE